MHDVLDVAWINSDMRFKLHVTVERVGGGGLTKHVVMTIWLVLIRDTIRVYNNFVKKKMQLVVTNKA